MEISEKEKDKKVRRKNIISRQMDLYITENKYFISLSFFEIFP